MSPEAWADARFRIEAAGLNVPIEWPNEPFSQPDSSGGIWLSVEANADISMPIEMGNNSGWEEQGHIYGHFYAPLNSGTDTVRALAKQLTNAFRGVGPQATQYYKSSLGSGQLDDSDGSWWRLTVWISYKYQDEPLV